MVGSAERKGEGSSSMEDTEGLRKCAILRVGLPPVGDTMSSSLSSKMAYIGSTILGVSRFFTKDEIEGKLIENKGMYHHSSKLRIGVYKLENIN